MSVNICQAPLYLLKVDFINAAKYKNYSGNSTMSSRDFLLLTKSYLSMTTKYK